MSKEEIEKLIHELFGDRAEQLIALLEEHAKDCQRGEDESPTDAGGTKAGQIVTLSKKGVRGKPPGGRREAWDGPPPWDSLLTRQVLVERSCRCRAMDGSNMRGESEHGS